MNVRIILLAAGNSRRFGTNKLFYELDGKPMYRHILDRLVNICGRHPGWEIVVVSQYEKLIEDVKGLPVFPVFCEESKNGVSYSIRAGILAAPEAMASEQIPFGRTVPEAAGFRAENAPDAAYFGGGTAPEAYAFFVADQPFFGEETAENFLKTMEREQAPLGCVSCNGETGNPVWFSKGYVPELLALSGDTGGKRVLKAHLEHARFFPVEDPKELRDLDIRPLSSD